MDKIRISYSFPIDLFGGWSFRCLYFDSISEVIDFYFQHPEATSFEITATVCSAKLILNFTVAKTTGNILRN